ncbi:uncharacterized protein BYT42DRAFT_618754 [Radiomyces spectabilis]|uniref:uncharacterized protein n=1 Tax=Radiomyces spectabilis TaxID=64574 RepID=UPI002220DB5C|nr:uncharacterized protein BYT42DRAFT_618754 [Radiomyces spectabilis]KAI8365381.1 hypothetical protein BYT42DRAFT_618754 [Radiomyces spectabilis]
MRLVVKIRLAKVLHLPQMPLTASVLRQVDGGTSLLTTLSNVLRPERSFFARVRMVLLGLDHCQAWKLAGYNYNCMTPTPIDSPNNIERTPAVGIVVSATFQRSPKGGLPGISEMDRSVLMKAEHQGLLVVVPLNEAYTSKCANKSQERTLQPVRDDENEELHSILVCKEASCKTMWKHDVVASKNIYQMTASIASGEGRPEIFQHAPL